MSDEMTPLERAARALCESSHGEGSWDCYNRFQRDIMIIRVRSVLMAVREPSGELLRVINGCSTYYDWQYMIDAILVE